MSGFSLNAAVEQYVAWDPNPESREEMGAILKKNDESLLKPLVSSRLAFGTAGLRAPMGLGYACMNELVVLQTTQGLIHYLRDVLGEEEMQNRVSFACYCLISLMRNCRVL